MMTVAFVLVSHSADVATAVVALARQMAPAVRIFPVGGTADGKMGTDVGRVLATCEEAESVAQNVILMADLGSAQMAADMAIEMQGDTENLNPRLRIGPGPFLEGTVAGAAVAGAGGEVNEVVKAISASAAQWKTPSTSPVSGVSSSGPRVEAVVADSAGLHARPAAKIAGMATAAPAQIYIDGVEADSVIDIMSLGARQGDTVVVSSPEDSAHEAVEQIATAISTGLDSE